MLLSNFVVRSGTSSELVKSILDIRRRSNLTSRKVYSNIEDSLLVSDLTACGVDYYFFHFQQAISNSGYALLRFPVEGDCFERVKGAVLLDFFISSDCMKSDVLGAVMLSYLASYCGAHDLKSLSVNLLSCEAENLLILLLKKLVPGVLWHDTMALLNSEHLYTIANSITYNSRKC